MSTGSGRGHGLGVGPDGNVWFIGPAGIGRVTPSLAVVHPGFGVPGDITTGPDGNLWFVAFEADGVVGRYDPTSGTVSTFDAGLHYPEEIVAGPDGNLWITSGGNDRIVRVTPQGQSTIFWPPSVDRPWGIAPGPDGNLWFSSHGNDRVGRISPSGVLTTFEDPAGRLDGPVGLAWGPGGYLYVASEANDRLGVVDTSGQIATLPVPAEDAPGPSALVASSDSVYYLASDHVVRLFPSEPPTAPVGLAATTPVFGQIRLAWSPPASNAAAVTGYRVYRDGVAVGSTTDGVRSLTDTGLVPGQSYHDEVAALHSGGESARAAVDATFPATGSVTIRVTGEVPLDVAFEGCVSGTHLHDHADRPPAEHPADTDRLQRLRQLLRVSGRPGRSPCDRDPRRRPR